MDKEQRQIGEAYALFAEKTKAWILRLDKLTESGFDAEALLVEMLILEEMVRQSVIALSYVQKVTTAETFPRDDNGAPVLGNNVIRSESINKATFGKLVVFYKILRPQATALAKDLEHIVRVRNQFFHGFLQKDEKLVALLKSMPEEFQKKPVKDIMLAIIEDMKSVMFTLSPSLVGEEGFLKNFDA